MVEFFKRALSKIYWAQLGKNKVTRYSRHLYTSIGILFWIPSVNLGILINQFNIEFFSLHWIHIFYVFMFLYLIFLSWIHFYKYEELRGYLIAQKYKEESDFLDKLAGIYVTVNTVLIIFLWLRMFFI